MAKKNKKYIIYIHVDYIRLLVAQEGDFSHEAIRKMQNRVYDQINDFLMGDGDGSLYGSTFVGPDGKEYKSFEVIRVSDCKTIADVRYFNRLKRKKYSR